MTSNRRGGTQRGRKGFNPPKLTSALFLTLAFIAGNQAAFAAADDHPISTFISAVDHPGGMAFDRQGNLLVVETDRNRVLRITPFGLVTTAAGLGSSSEFAPGELGARVNLNAPEDLALDAAGNLYIADTGNGRVLKITSGASVETVPGLDGPPFLEISGLAVDPFGNLFVADREGHRVWKKGIDGSLRPVAGTGEPGFSGDGGPASRARLNEPSGMVVDRKGHLFIADSMNHRIRRVDADGTISTVAGSKSKGYGGDSDFATKAKLTYPTDVAIDSQGTLFIADRNNHRVRQVIPGGIITTLAGVGSLNVDPQNTVLSRFLKDGTIAEKSALEFPTSVALDDGGALFIAETGRIRKVTGASFVISEPDAPGGPSSIPDVLPNITPVTLDIYPGQKVAFDLPVYGVRDAVLVSGLLMYSGSKSSSAIQVQSVEGIKETVDFAAVPENDGVRVRLLSGTPLSENSLIVRGTLQVSPLATEGNRFTLTWVEIKAVDKDGQPLQLASNQLVMTVRTLLGDLNADGRVDVNDARMALDIVTGKLSPVPPRVLELADVAPKKTDGTYGDRVVMVNDVIRLLRRAVGLEKQWP